MQFYARTHYPPECLTVINNNAKEEACRHTTCIKYIARIGEISPFFLFLTSHQIHV